MTGRQRSRNPNTTELSQFLLSRLFLKDVQIKTLTEIFTHPDTESNPTNMIISNIM
jgi:hypothetical protein